MDREDPRRHERGQSDVAPASEHPVEGGSAPAREPVRRAPPQHDQGARSGQVRQPQASPSGFPVRQTEGEALQGIERELRQARAEGRSASAPGMAPVAGPSEAAPARPAQVSEGRPVRAPFDPEKRERWRARKAAAAAKAAAMKPRIAETVFQSLPKPDFAKGMAPSLRKRRGLLATSLVLLWLLPTLLVGFYFFFQASNQYWVGAQFSVRGTSTGSLADLGLDFLPSSGTQSSDSYIVADYISSVQLVEDLRDQLDIDLRQFYARPEIDWLYRIDPDMPLEEFAGYWAWQVDVSFNSTTGTTDLIVQAFTAEDAKTIADAILVVSERLINDLSASAREQLISTAQAEVSRTEERLGAVRRKMRDFRNREQSLDPTQLGVREASIVATLEAQLAELKTRRRTLVGTISSDSPSIRVLDREIAAIETQISEQLARIGSGQSAESGTTSDEASSTRNLSAVLDEYLELSLEEEFAVKAYTASLTSLEAADADARKMQRYFATYVFPKLPTTSLHPRRLLWTAAASFWFLCIWAVAYFVTRSVRDHAI